MLQGFRAAELYDSISSYELRSIAVVEPIDERVEFQLRLTEWRSICSVLKHLSQCRWSSRGPLLAGEARSLDKQIAELLQRVIAQPDAS